MDHFSLRVQLTCHSKERFCPLFGRLWIMWHDGSVSVLPVCFFFPFIFLNLSLNLGRLEAKGDTEEDKWCSLWGDNKPVTLTVGWDDPTEQQQDFSYQTHAKSWILHCSNFIGAVLQHEESNLSPWMFLHIMDWGWKHLILLDLKDVCVIQGGI